MFGDDLTVKRAPVTLLLTGCVFVTKESRSYFTDDELVGAFARL